jgi:NADH dehydrogenase FAD-containing subunit
MRRTVAIVGGGYGGFTAAKALDDVADVVLIERKDAFFHNIAALRALVEPDWLPRIFYPYDKLLGHGRVVHGRAVQVHPDRVELDTGEVIAADYIVLATGSTYPYPAKSDVDSSAEATRKLTETHAALAAADRVLLLGAGPVGLELAGEITSAWPDKHVTIVDPLTDILNGPFDEALRVSIRQQLEQRGVRLRLGSRLAAEPPTPAGTVAPFTVHTVSGEEIAADLWLRCYGAAPVTDYLDEALVDTRTSEGLVSVTPQLRVVGYENVFAIGDINTVEEPKMGGRAARQGEVVAANIRALIDEGEPIDYQPAPPVILLPLGPDGGASQVPGHDEIQGPEFTARLKGQDLFTGRYRETFGL